MHSRLPAGLLALLLSAAPAVAVLCTMDCRSVEVHSCHESQAPADGDVIGAGPQSCTHPGYEAAPATPTLQSIVAPDALPAVSASPRMGLSGIPWTDVVSDVPHRAVPPSLLLPLRI